MTSGSAEPELRELQGRILRQDPALEPEAQRLRGYRLLGQIGSGSFGVVHRALQPHVGREVAVKVISPRLANDPRFVRRFVAEAQLVARLEHPRIVPLYDYWRDPDGAYLVMRLLRGGNLKRELETGALELETGALEPERAVGLVGQIASGLAVAHRQGIVHRDVKPANILLDEDGDAYLSDFGIATDVAAEVAPQGPDTSAYLSPEQARGEPVTPRTDVYSLGTVLREALAGAIQAGPLAEIVGRATAEEPADRYADAEAMAEALSSVRTAKARVGVSIPTRNPYKGLRPFEEADAADFFGREILVERLVERLNDGARFVALVGASGSGKSSAVRAGLFPALRRGAAAGSSDWFLAEMSPGTQPLEALEEALRRVAIGSSSTLTGERDSGLLLFVDQLEELFTLVERAERRDQFLGLLAAAASDPKNQVRVVAALRADFYDRPLGHPEFASLLRSGVETVVPPSPEELERLIADPAERVGVECEPGLVGEVVVDVSGRTGALPLLQYGLTELFERRRDGVMTLAAYRELGGVGGAVARRAEELYEEAGPLGREAARQLFLRLVALGGGTIEARRRVSRSELASLEVDQAALEEVVSAFGRHRLLSFDRDPQTRAPTVEVAHEALLRAWDRLGGWIEEARGDVQMRARLSSAASEWHAAQGDPSFLLGGTRLDLFDAWAQSSSLALARPEREYLDASRERREAAWAEEKARRAREDALERRSRRRLRALVLVLAAAAAGAAALSIFAFDQRGDARAEAVRAEEQARIATARELAAAVTATVEDDPELALLLALEAVEATRAADGTALREAEEALRTAVHASRVVRSVPGVSAVALAPDGSRVASAGRDGSVTIRGTASGEQLLVLPEQSDGIRGVVFGPDGSRILTFGEDGTVRIWDAGTGEQTRAFAAEGGAGLSPDAKLLAVKSGATTTVHVVETGRVLARIQVRGEPLALSGDGSLLALGGDGVRVVTISGGQEVLRAEGDAYDAAFSPDSSLFAAVGIDLADVWRLDTGERAYVVGEMHPITTSVDFSRDGGRIATAAHDGAARVWDAKTGRELLRLAGRGTEIDNVAFSADGRLLAAAGKSGRATVWDLTPEGRRELLTIPATSEDPVYFSVAFSHDGRRLAGASDPATVEVWDAGTGRPVATLPGHRAPVTDASFTRDGDRLVTTSFDGSARLWEVSGGMEIRSFAGHSAPVWGAALSPDDSRLATVSEDHSARVWDLETGTTRLVLRHTDQVYDVDYSPDGSLLATSGLDGAWIWDASTGDELARLVGHEGNVVQIAFGPEGERIATAGFDGMGRRYRQAD